MSQGVEIELDKKRILKYKIRSLLALEKKTGKKIKDLFKELADINPDDVGLEVFESMGEVLWAGLIHEDKELTTDNCIDMLEDILTEGGDFGAIMDSIGNAFRDSGIMKSLSEEDKKKVKLEIEKLENPKSETQTPESPSAETPAQVQA